MAFYTEPIRDRRLRGAARETMASVEKNLHWVILGAAVLAGGLGFWASHRWLQTPSAEPVAMQSALLYPQPKVIADFQLRDPAGQAFTLERWRGHWNLVFFGFTNCPDVCPTSLAVARDARKLLQAEAPDIDLKVSFISVDPERDEPKLLADYVRFFDADFLAATGTVEALTALTAPLGVIFAKVPTGDGPFDYTIDHTASLLIVDPEGRLKGLIRPPHDAARIAADLKLLAKDSR